MFFRWFKNRRRRRLLSAPFPDSWLDIIESNVSHYPCLTKLGQARVRQFVQVFVHETNWEGVSGFVMTDEVKVTIAAQAALLVIGRNDLFEFDHVLSVLVYPDVFQARKTQTMPSGVVIEGREARLGEAWYRGPVILSWEDSLQDGRGQRPGANVVLHEFAHQLDMRKGQQVDGVPELPSPDMADRWNLLCGKEFQRLRRRCRNGEAGPIDCYGTTNPAEFFAVVTETFFESPQWLEESSPDLYDLFADYYGLDPARW